MSNNISTKIIQGLRNESDNWLSNTPGYTLVKTLLTSEAEVRRKRVEELVAIIEENKQKFTVNLINNECFISGLTLTLQEIVQQYSDLKRTKIYSIFLGFTDSEDKENFELEKMYNTLNLASLNDLEILQTFSSRKFKEKDSHFSQKNSVERYSGLIALGLIKSTTEFKERKGLDFKLNMKLRKDPVLAEYTKELNKHLNKIKFTEQTIHYEFTSFGRRFSEYVFQDLNKD